jgi:hypothetical protein
MNKTPFWKEILGKVEEEIGLENTLFGLMLGSFITVAYWKFCKDKK